jgi:hypothetical protein
VNQNEFTLEKSKSKVSEKFFQPAEPWILIFIFVFVSLLLIGLGSFGAKILNIFFPVFAFAIGCFFYFRYPILYNGFVWWMFFITPFVRRICDWRQGAFTPPSGSYILLAPFLVTLISGHTLYSNLPKVREQGSAPFVMALAAVLYGYLVGVINGDPIKTTTSLLEWITPILFGFHLYVNWKRYPIYTQNIKRVFLWGVLIMGIYGIYQFLVAPEWDRLWMIGSGMDSSAGSPVPLGMRVWSTLNSQGPYADYATTGLLILLSCEGALVAPAAGVGALSLLLSLVRTAWLGWIAAMLSLLASLNPKQKFRIVVSIAVLVIVMIPLISMEPFSKVILGRLETMTNLQSDGSGQARQVTYAILIDEALSEVVGRGIGSFDTDSAVLVLFMNLGWIGVIPYVGSLLFGCILIFIEKNNNNDLMIPIIRGILIKSLLFLLASPTMRGSQGMLLWSFLGLGLSGRMYYQNYSLQKLLLLREK